MYLNIYIAMAILTGLIFSTVAIAVSKDTNKYYNYWGVAQDTMMGMFGGMIWPLSVTFFAAGWISNWGSDWLLKKLDKD